MDNNKIVIDFADSEVNNIFSEKSKWASDVFEILKVLLLEYGVYSIMCVADQPIDKIGEDYYLSALNQL